MKKLISILLIAFTVQATAQKATVEDINKSMVEKKVTIDKETFTYLSVPIEMLDRIKNENGYSGVYDVKGLELASTLSNIQKNDIQILSLGQFLISELVEANDTKYFKYPKEFQLASLKANIDKLEKIYPTLNTKGYKAIYEACQGRLNSKKEADKKAL